MSDCVLYEQLATDVGKVVLRFQRGGQKDVSESYRVFCLSCKNRIVSFYPKLSVIIRRSAIQFPSFFTIIFLVQVPATQCTVPLINTVAFCPVLFAQLECLPSAAVGKSFAAQFQCCHFCQFLLIINGKCQIASLLFSKHSHNFACGFCCNQH